MLGRCVARTLAARNHVVLLIRFAVGTICVVQQAGLVAMITGSFRVVERWPESPRTPGWILWRESIILTMNAIVPTKDVPKRPYGPVQMIYARALPAHSKHTLMTDSKNSRTKSRIRSRRHWNQNWNLSFRSLRTSNID